MIALILLILLATLNLPIELAREDKSIFHYSLTYAFLNLLSFVFLIGLNVMLFKPLFRIGVIKKYLNKPSNYFLNKGKRKLACFIFKELKLISGFHDLYPSKTDRLSTILKRSISIFYCRKLMRRFLLFLWIVKSCFYSLSCKRQRKSDAKPKKRIRYSTSRVCVEPFNFKCSRCYCR